MRAVTTLWALIALNVYVSAVVPDINNRIGGNHIYPKDPTISYRPTEETILSIGSDEIIKGRFWLDGETTISVENGKYYFWQFATVHSP